MTDPQNSGSAESLAEARASARSQSPMGGNGSVKLAPLPCGLVLFDHPEEVGSGTAYLVETSPQRIRSPNDLRNDALWVSNLSTTEERTRSHPTLRNSYYFRVLLSEIANDMGIQSSREGQMSLDDALKISTIMTRTMTIAARAYGWDVSEMGPLRVSEQYLMRDIVKMLPSSPTPDARYRDDLIRALTQAHQENSEPDWPGAIFEPDSVFVTLRFNRVTYAQQLLDCQVPAGRAWSRLENVQMDNTTLRYCLSHPTVVKATIEWDNTPTEIAALAAYGQAGKRRNAMRVWMTQPELSWISRYAKVTIHSVWVDDSGYTRLSPAGRLPPLFAAHPESCLSYSAGLVAHNHWQALASCTWNRRSRIDESNVWAAWLRALDRAQMFSMALKAHQAGFHVDRYGSGSLRLRVTRSRLPDLVRFKEEHGFMYPEISGLIKKHTLE